MSAAEPYVGSWAHRFGIRLISLQVDSGLVLRVYIPTDYAAPYRGDIAFHACEPPALAEHNAVRVSFDGKCAAVTTHADDQVLRTLLSRPYRETDPESFATTLWRDWMHGAAAWMTVKGAPQ